MEQFFKVVGGGLLAVTMGILIAYGGSLAWRVIEPRMDALGLPSISGMAAALSPRLNDAESISGFSRTIRYTAVEEEDLVDSALRSLSGERPKGSVSASAYAVTNLSKNNEVISRNADTMVPVASLTKLVTAVVAKQKIDSTKRITIIRSIMSTYGNTAEFRVGETFEALDLLYPLLMVSSNDAAEAFAGAYGRPKFVREMNDFAQSIGAYRTYFADPSGLSPLDLSTAHDTTLILDWIRVHEPQILSITTEKSRTVRSHTWVNPAHFLNWSTYLGGKNGYTPEANRTGALLFTVGQKKDIYSVVVLGSEMRDDDVVTLLEKIK